MLPTRRRTFPSHQVTTFTTCTLIIKNTLLNPAASTLLAPFSFSSCFFFHISGLRLWSSSRRGLLQQRVETFGRPSQNLPPACALPEWASLQVPSGSAACHRIGTNEPQFPAKQVFSVLSCPVRPSACLPASPLNHTTPLLDFVHSVQ